MYFTIYRITNLINGKIYVGAHKTKNLDDSYMGGGNRIEAAIKKYGKENFKREYIDFLPDEDSMYDREAELVTEEFVARPDTYNLIPGGRRGGVESLIKTRKKWIGGVQSDKARRKLEDSMQKYWESDRATERKIKQSDDWKSNHPMKDKEVSKKVSEKLTGKPKTQEHKDKIADSLRGKSNKNYPKNRKTRQIVFDIVQCPHCQKEGKKNAMMRWHFDKCVFR